MIDFLRGRLVRKDPVSVSIDVNGVGYSVSISLQTYEKLPSTGEEVLLLTHLHVREDAMHLFGFLHENERSLFRKLQGVSGIGAKIALNVLSKCGASEFRDYVVSGNVGALTSIPGIGKKTAERIVMELRDKLDRSDGTTLMVDVPNDDPRREAIMALLALGYSRQVAEKAILKAMHEVQDDDRHTSGLIRVALRDLSS